MSVFDPVEFVAYIGRRWPVIAISCGIAFALAFTVSEILPKRYTAVASLIIQPPGGNDPRAATAVSPVYLESLKTYERFATSDTLFVRALEFVHARDRGSSGSVESLKDQILKVSKPLNTSLLEISATLGDPAKAQAFAQYIAEQTVALSRTLDEQTSTDLATDFRTQLNAAKSRVEAAQKSRESLNSGLSVDLLQRDIREGSALKEQLGRDLETDRTELADLTAQQQELKSDVGNTDDARYVSRRIAAATARIAAIEKQTVGLENGLAKKERLLQSAEARSETLDAEESSARIAYEAAARRMDEMLAAARFRGERLQIVDRGIVPQRPSSPNPVLTTLAAVLIALMGSFAYLILRFSHARLVNARAERAYSLR